MKKSLFKLMFVVILLVAVIANVGAQKKLYEIAAGPTGGNFYPMAIGIEKVLAEKMNCPYTTKVIVTGGSTDNANLLARRQVDMGIVTQPDAQSLYEGTGPWNGRAFKDLQIITPLIPGHIRLVVRADANVKTLADLKGKRFSPGQMGSGEQTFWDIWTACGYKKEDLRREYLDLSGIVDALKDGKIDGAYLAGSEPYSALTDLKTSMGDKIQIYSFTDEEIKKIVTAYPKYAPWVSKAGTYPNQKTDSTIIAYHYYLATTGDLPDEIAYLAAKGLNEQQKWLSSIHAGYINLDAAKAPGIMGMTPDIPIHKGALKYWKEVGAIK